METGYCLKQIFRQNYLRRLKFLEKTRAYISKAVDVS
jgi:hypothetical protein